MSLFKIGDFALHSGSRSPWKIDCDALTSEDWGALALMIKDRVPAFGCVVGIPTGGMKLEQALTRYEVDNDRVLIVDDVLTTAASMEKERRIYLHASSIIHGAVVFARGPCPDWVTPLFQMPVV